MVGEQPRAGGHETQEGERQRDAHPPIRVQDQQRTGKRAPEHGERREDPPPDLGRRAATQMAVREDPGDRERQHRGGDGTASARTTAFWPPMVKPSRAIRIHRAVPESEAGALAAMITEPATRTASIPTAVARRRLRLAVRRLASRPPAGCQYSDPTRP